MGERTTQSLETVRVSSRRKTASNDNPIGGPVLRAAAAFRASSLGLPPRRSRPVYIAGALGVAHALSTVKAAGINLAIAPWQPPERQITDEATLSDVLRRFEPIWGI